MILRPYQREAIDALYAWFHANPDGNPMLILPTGAGKSVILATLIREILEAWPDQRVLMLTHVKELIAQNAAKLNAVWPLTPMGIYSASLRRRDTFEPILFAGIQSVWNKAMQIGRFDLVIVDECHLISHNRSGMYRSLLDELHRINPALRVIGLTATPFRTGHGSLIHGEHALFSDVAYEVKLLDLVGQGYLAPLVSKRMATEIDLSGVGIRQGEYVQRELEATVDRDEITQAALDEVQAYGSTRKSWLVFCAGVAHAEHVSDALRARGIAAGCVTGKTPALERDRLIAEYRSGRLRALTNANVLTTGFDAPQTDLLVMLRPTHSPGLYVQMAGRGMRTSPGKTDCLVLDFAGNVMLHGPVDQVQAWIPRPKEGGTAPSKECPECSTIVATAVRQCPQCGFLFPFEATPRHEAIATDAAVLSDQMGGAIETHPVTDVYYRYHQRGDKLPTLRVDYYRGLARVASEWICFEHEGYPRAKAVQWWARRAPGSAIPATVDEAMSRTDQLLEPSSVTINSQPRYPEIIRYAFDTKPQAEHGRHVA